MMNDASSNIIEQNESEIEASKNNQMISNQKDYREHEKMEDRGLKKQKNAQNCILQDQDIERLSIGKDSNEF